MVPGELHGRSALVNERFAERVRRRDAVIGVVGLGYVGMPLAMAFAGAGFRVVGVDAVPERVRKLAAGESYLIDIPAEVLRPQLAAGRFRPTLDYAELRDADVIFVCVPTPFDRAKAPDLSYVEAAARSIAAVLRTDQLVILESTTYPGTTEEVLQTRLEAAGFTIGRDIFLAFSPERVDPGNEAFTTANIPKVVGGVTPACTDLAAALYATVTSRVHRVSSPRVAETAKLLENTFRSVNIALANELALACRAIDVDPWEVIDAAATKPFGFMPFYPGPGTGGHCIPLDPLYFSWKLRLSGFETRFIALADEINRGMPRHVVSLVSDALNERGRCLRGSTILVLGVTYKRDVNDVRESPALEIIELLEAKGARVEYSDPYVPQLMVGGLKLDSVPLGPDTLRQADGVVVVTDHRVFDYPAIARDAVAIVDVRNALRDVTEHRDKIVTL
jgi:UDP-N-acetyl-D-glucosamine dehydrogenase